MLVPPGTPTGLGSFMFHDRGHDRAEAADSEASDGGDASPSSPSTAG